MGKCNYNLYDPDVSNCETIFSITDENNHIWLAVANNEDKGSILEINPDTKSIISSIDVDDPDLVDIVFAGDDLDFLYVLSTKNLYKITGMGVHGNHVPDFI